MNKVDLALHCEMFDCMDKGITEDKNLTEVLGQVLVDQFNYDYPEAEVYADLFVRNNYADIAADVQMCQTVVAEEQRDYQIMVGAC